MPFDGIQKKFRFGFVQGLQFLFLDSGKDSGVGGIGSNVAVGYCLL